MKSNQHVTTAMLTALVTELKADRIANQQPLGLRVQRRLYRSKYYKGSHPKTYLKSLN